MLHIKGKIYLIPFCTNVCQKLPMRATSVTEKAGSSTSASHSFRSFAPSRIVPHRLPFFHYRAPADDGAALIMFVCVFITRDKVRINIIYIYAIYIVYFADIPQLSTQHKTL